MSTPTATPRRPAANPPAWARAAALGAEAAAALHTRNPYATGGTRAGAQWPDLDASYRRYLTEKCRQVQHRPAA